MGEVILSNPVHNGIQNRWPHAVRPVLSILVPNFYSQKSRNGTEWHDLPLNIPATYAISMSH
jgi:hypothetical protein